MNIKDYTDKGWHVESISNYIKAVSPDGAVNFIKG